jgi:hypothetical protein
VRTAFVTGLDITALLQMVDFVTVLLLLAETVLLIRIVITPMLI